MMDLISVIISVISGMITIRGGINAVLEQKMIYYPPLHEQSRARIFAIGRTFFLIIFVCTFSGAIFRGLFNFLPHEFGGAWIQCGLMFCFAGMLVFMNFKRSEISRVYSRWSQKILFSLISLVIYFLWQSFSFFLLDWIINYKSSHILIGEIFISEIFLVFTTILYFYFLVSKVYACFKVYRYKNMKIYTQNGRCFFSIATDDIVEKGAFIQFTANNNMVKLYKKCICFIEYTNE